MATNHDVWDAVTPTDGEPGNSYELMLDVFRGGSFRNIPDVTNIAPAFTGKMRQRQTYAQKGSNSSTKVGDDLVLTFDVEIVRDANGLWQPDLQDLVNASKVKGAANRRRIRVYDALGADYAFDGQFAISIARTNPDWDSTGFITVTATQFTPSTWIANPVLVGILPVIREITPGQATATTELTLEGSGFTGAAGAAAVKFGTTNAASYSVKNDRVMTVVVPTVANGSQPVTVTTPAGTSAPAPFTKV